MTQIDLSKWENFNPINVQVAELESYVVIRRGFQDVLVIQMLAGCASGISSALIG